jgi:type IV secretion system protein VirB6
MGFFATFSTWLNGILATYIGDHTARLASILQPTIVTLATVYVMVWGYLQLTGKVEEPFITGVKRIITLVVILGGALDLWLYHDLIIDTFFNAPGAVAAAMIGTYDSVTIVDQVLFTGGDAANLLIQKGGVFQGDFSYYIAGVVVYIVVGITAVYAMFLLTLSKIALSVLLALGPLFIALLFFDTTKRFFESWIAQMANYAFITILIVMVSALMMGVVTAAAQQAAAQGGGIGIADAARVCIAAGLTFLVMRQVMPMAAGLASGLALSSFGAMSALMAWGLGATSRNVLRPSGQFTRGLLMDKETSRWDTLPRKAGYALRQRLVRRENAIRKVGT